MAVDQLSKAPSDGTKFGQSATDLIAFYGKTPIAQPTGSAQAALTRGSAGGVIATIATASLSPTSILTITSTEKSITLGPATADFQVATTDMLFCVNKLTSQAGLGVGNVRVSAANTAGLTFTNFTAGTLTPTASQIYSFIALRGMNTLTAVLTPAAVAANDTREQQFTVAGLRAGGLVQVTKPTAQAGLDIAGCRVVSDNTLGITFVNVSAASITPTAAESYTVFDMAGLDAISNVLVYQSSQSPASIANATSAEQSLTVTGLVATDVVAGISKPTAQAGLAIANQRVASANTLGITFGNFTAASITPTAAESYAITVFRHNPVAPLVLYSQTLTPSSVAANTTAEQTFTVTGLVSTSLAWVNKPTAQVGLGIMGVRVSALNTLAVTYTNSTAVAIVPTSETYLIGNFQIPATDASGAVLQPASVTAQSQSVLANALRSASVNSGLIAGA